MFNLILVFHIALCIFLIIVVLLQQGKGADAGAAFAGGSNTVFGAGGATTMLTKVTTTSAILFMITSIMLVNSYGSFVGSTSTGKVNLLEGSILENQAEQQNAPAAAVEAKPDPATKPVEAKPAPVKQ